MFCFNCGQQLIEGAKFCSACGTKVVNTTPASPTTASQSEPTPQAETTLQHNPQPTTQPVTEIKPTLQQTTTKETTAKPKRNKKLITVIVILLIASGIGLAMLIEDEMHSDSPYKIESYDGTGSPEATFRGLMSAIQRQDTYAVSDYMSSSNKWNTSWIYDMSIYSYEIISSNSSNYKASIKARLNTSEGTMTRTFRFVKENGKWVLDN